MKKIALIITLLTTYSIGNENEDFIKKQMTAQPIFQFTLNIFTKDILNILLPNGFKPFQSVNTFSKAKIANLEFIPNNENIDAWTEIITLYKVMRMNRSAINTTEALKKGLSNFTENTKILFTSSNKENSIEHSFFIMQYEVHNKIEILGASNFSGPTGYAGAQYTIRLKNPENISEVVNKIENFFRDNFFICKFEDCN